MLTTSLAVLTAVTAPAVAGSAPIAVPIDPGSWVTPADYPVTAMRNLQEGATGFVVTVNSQGRVTSCSITASSGTSALDEATCRLVQERGRFRPARDAGGKPVPSRFASRIRWVIPTGPAPVAGRLVFTYRVGTDGIVSDCKVVEQSGGAPVNRYPDGTPRCTQVPRFQPYRGSTGEPVARRVRATLQLEVEPAE